MIPGKLRKGDEIRVVSPSKSLSLILKENRKIALKRFNKLGFKVSFSKNSEETDEFESSSIKSRIGDIHEAFLDKNVKAILSTIGGFNSNQLLKYLNYNLIKKNPKIFGGYSDTTALLNAIYSKTNLVTYSSPSFSSFSMLKGFEYTLEYFKKCLVYNLPFEVKPSDKWSDDIWWKKDQKNRKFIKNKGHYVINKGEAEGTIIGGNQCTLNLLQGTEFMPPLKDSILFLEDDYEVDALTFDRDLQSLIHQKDFEKVKAIIIGRFQKASKMKKELLIKIIKTKEELNSVPTIADVDFGHTNPQITFPIGGKAKVIADKNKIELKITKH